MSRTEFTKANADFSDLAHIAARMSIYPMFFETNDIEYSNTTLSESLNNAVRDSEQAIDRICHVSICDKWFTWPLKFTIQERFRRMRFRDFQDITLTVWNHASGLPSELYKIEADYFVYGYYDDIDKTLYDVVIVDVPELKRMIAKGMLGYKQGTNNKMQSFISIPFNSLRQAGLIVWQLSKVSGGGVNL